MAYTATKNTQGNYEIFQDGKRISTGTASILGNYGLSATNLGMPVAPAPAPTPAPTPAGPTVYPYSTNANPVVPTYTAPTSSGNSSATPTIPTISSYGLTPEQYANIVAAQKSLGTLNQLKAAGINELPKNVDIKTLIPTTPTTSAAPTVPTTPNTSSQPFTAAPGFPSLATQTSPINSSETSNQLLDRLLKAMVPSSEETGLQGRLANLEASRRLSYQDIEGQPIATPFITGQKAAIDKTIDLQSQNVSTQLANLQGQRNSVVTALGSALQFQKPTSLSIGETLVNPLTGEVIAGSGNIADKQSMDTFYNLLQQYPDAGIVYDPNKSWSDNLTAAQQLASRSPSFEAKGTVYAINPLTGEPQVIHKMTGPSGWESGGGSTIFGPGTAASAPSSGGSGGGISVGSSGSAVSALQQWLISKGFTIPDGPTGYYGPQTQAAVAAFQQAAGVDTSGGGVGTFGPRTRAAAAAQGFSMPSGSTGGATSGGGSTGGSSSPSMTGLAPQLRAALVDLGGLQFFDASKVTPQQLPYLQRAAQQYGVPLLAKEDANKIQESYSAVKGSGALVNQIKDLSGKVLLAGNDRISMTMQAARLAAIEKAPGISTDDNAKKFIAARNSILSLIARAAGEKGTLTEQDVQRIAQALPSYSDNKELAKQKAAELSQVLEAVFRGSVQAYLGNSAPATGSSGGGNEPAGPSNDPMGIR